MAIMRCRMVFICKRAGGQQNLSSGFVVSLVSKASFKRRDIGKPIFEPCFDHWGLGHTPFRH